MKVNINHKMDCQNLNSYCDCDFKLQKMYLSHVAKTIA